jgi:3-methyladenine DNA glycosylase Tag
MTAPEQIKPQSLSDYLDVLTKAVFQSGISWRVVEAKWPGTRAALYDFDPRKLARLTPKDVDSLAQDTRVIRNHKKIEATVENAQTLLDLDKQHHGFSRYLKSFDSFDAASADLIKQFRFLGNTGAYYFLYCVGESVPPHEEWMAARQAMPRSSRRPT